MIATETIKLYGYLFVMPVMERKAKPCGDYGDLCKKGSHLSLAKESAFGWAFVGEKVGESKPI